MCWHKERASNQETLSQYGTWLDICHENNIKLVRVFLTRWSINALFDNDKLDLLTKVIEKAANLDIEVILVLNNFTDFTEQYYRDLHKAEYIWDDYPLKEESVKKFFTKLDNDFMKKNKEVLSKLSEYKNITKIELFNEIDLVNINNRTLIKWVNRFARELSEYQKRYKFYVSISNHNDLKLFKDKLCIPLDVHSYSFPYEYAFKNIEYFKKKLGNTYYLGEYAKFSDDSHLKIYESKFYFCSGLWGSYLQGFTNSPLHWWWEKLLANSEYLKIINVFQKYSPNKPGIIFGNNFKILKLETSQIKLNSSDKIKKDKILFRLKTLIHHPAYIKNEWGAISKFMKKKILSYVNEKPILIRNFEDSSYIYFYCEPKKYQQINFQIHVKGIHRIGNIESINLLNGVSKQIKYKEKNETIIITCHFSSIHLIKIRKY